MKIVIRCAAGMSVLLGVIGCADRTPPPQRVPVPPAEGYSRVERDPTKPLPAPPRESQLIPPPFIDEPLVNQRPPEQNAFLDAYNRVGRPRVVVFMNRTMEGKIVPVNADQPVASIRHTRHDNRTATRDEAIDVYLQPGQYDEATAKSLDYEAVETILADALGCNGQVLLTSPTLARQRLTDQQVKDLQSGRPVVLSELAEQLSADVLVQAQAHPTRQAVDAPMNIRVIVEAMNTRGGQSLGRAVVDIPPPLDKPQINRFTRYLARKLMDDMTGAWLAPPPPELRRENPRESTAPGTTAPTTNP